MPLLSGIVPAIRVAVSSIVGALMLIIPVAPGAGAAHHRATAVGPPASTRIAQSTGLFATACVAAGSCTAGGNFGGAGRPLEPMIATQAHGRWSRGIPLLLPTNAAAQPYAQVTGLACHSAGNCVAVGDYQYGRSGNLQAFMAIESHGRWARAFTPRLPANADSPSSAQLEAVTCTSNGSCDAVGTYQDSAGNAQTMVAAKPPSGPWGQASEIASPPNAAANPDALMTGIACNAPESCVVAGNSACPRASSPPWAPSRCAAPGTAPPRSPCRAAPSRARSPRSPRSPARWPASASASASTPSRPRRAARWRWSSRRAGSAGRCRSTRCRRAAACGRVPTSWASPASRRAFASRSAAGGTPPVTRWPCASSGARPLACRVSRPAARRRVRAAATVGPVLGVVTSHFHCGAVGYYHDRFGVTRAQATATP